MEMRNVGRNTLLPTLPLSFSLFFPSEKERKEEEKKEEDRMKRERIRGEKEEERKKKRERL